MLCVCVYRWGGGGETAIYFLGVKGLVLSFSNRCGVAAPRNITVGGLGIGLHNLQHGSCAVP